MLATDPLGSPSPAPSCVPAAAERQQWQQEREEEIKRLEEFGRRLTQAWEDLENEQRDFQRTRQAFENRQRSATAPASGEIAGADRRAASVDENSVTAGRDRHPQRDESVRQFQQLRRELKTQPHRQ